MVTAFIGRERIRTTLAKAKELRGKVEKTITLGKKGTLHARRHALRLVADKDSLKKVFGPLAERYANRPGGYTRVIKLGHRLGDDAPMAFIELVDREGEAVPKPPAKGKKGAKVPTQEAAPEKSKPTKKKMDGGEKKRAPAKKAKTPTEKSTTKNVAPAKKKEEKKDDNDKSGEK
jgi:large subunit ribosomal protein L17